jgi:hypothetical protein
VIGWCVSLHEKGTGLKWSILSISAIILNVNGDVNKQITLSDPECAGVVHYVICGHVIALEVQCCTYVQVSVLSIFNINFCHKTALQAGGLGEKKRKIVFSHFTCNLHVSYSPRSHLPLMLYLFLTTLV